MSKFTHAISELSPAEAEAQIARGETLHKLHVFDPKVEALPGGGSKLVNSDDVRMMVGVGDVATDEFGRVLPPGHPLAATNDEMELRRLMDEAVDRAAKKKGGNMQLSEDQEALVKAAIESGERNREEMNRFYEAYARATAAVRPDLEQAPSSRESSGWQRQPLWPT